MSKIEVIQLDAGHGLPTPGRRTMKEFHTTVWQEWELNNRIAVKTENLLKDYDVEVIRLDDRTGKRDIPLRERTNKANKYNNAYLLSIHHNAGIKGGKGGGITTFIANNAQAKSKQLQKPFYDILIKNGALKGNRSKPNSAAAFWMLRNQKHPSILIEYGFMDSSTDVPAIVTEAYADKMAKGNVEFFEKHLGIKKISGAKPTPKPQPKPVKPKPTTKKYTSIVNYLKDNKQDSSFANRAKLAKEHGVKNYKGTAAQNIELLNILQGTKTRTGTIKPRQGANVRAGAGTGFRKAMNVLRYGTRVNILKEVNGWYEIEYQGKKGYVRKDLIQ